LLKLKKLELLGFKSFCDRTELIFNGSGITAIVGPNGCGKSNISDAINWVLGEQSAKSLRGGSMQDVIFNGTRDRQATGLAEVSLTLVDTDYHKPHAEESAGGNGSGALEPEAGSSGREGAEGPADGPHARHGGNGSAKGGARGANGRGNHLHNKAGEVVVSRRLYRSGESDYLLNGKLCRLRDVQDIFLGTGLGSDSYAIIEQGRVGQILNSKTYDRRALIEEAAGVTKYKTRRRLAEAKLESSRQNLNRVNDILDEVGRQVSSLKRQAARARRYGTLRQEFRSRLRVALASRHSELERQAMRSALELSVAGARLKEAAAGVEALEREHAELNQAGYQREEALRQQHEAMAALAIEAERTRNSIAYQRQQAAEMESRLREDEAQYEQLQTRLAAVEREQAAAGQAAQAAQAAGAAAQQEAAERATALARLEEAQGAAERQRERLRASLLNVIGEIAGLRNQLTQVEEYLAGLERQRERAEAEQNAAAREQAALLAQRDALAEGIARQQLELSSVAAERESAERRAAELRDEIAAVQRELEQLRGLHAEARARRDSLEQILSRHAYAGEAVKRLFSLDEGGFRPLGILGDFIEVDPRYERLVEDFLAEELEFVVVKGWESAEAGLRLLRGGAEGRVTFLVPPERPPAAEAGNSAFGFPQGLKPLREYVRLANALAGSAHLLLPKLAACYLADTAESARELALAHPSCFFLSPEGECFQGTTVAGGRRAGAGPLALKRELREVTERARELSGRSEAAAARLKALTDEAGALAASLDRLRRDEVEREKCKAGSDHELKQLAAQLQRAGERLSVAGLELERLGHESSRARETAARLRADAEAREASQREMEAAIHAADATAGETAEARQAATAALSEARARAAALEERLRGAQAAAERLADQVRHERAQTADLGHQVDFARQELERLAAGNEGLERRAAELAEQGQAAEAAAAALKAALEAGRQRLSELEERIRAARAALEQEREQKSVREVALARQQSDLAHLAETCLNEMGVVIGELGVDAAELLAGDALVDAEEQARQLRAKIESLGPVNMIALEEYQQMQTRFNFLNAQRQDLLDAIRDTQQTIQEMDAVSQKQFTEAFEAINANFRETFRILFGGGVGMMRLTEGAEAGESGIELIVQPPGKRLQNALLMSGGEKALTAMALLLAIFRYKPSPFCVLDEVDAPLDDSNIGRFTKLLLEMSLQTQFLIITHNKRTMEAAPVLYGVTMEELGVSKLVSVKFHDRLEGGLPPPPQARPTTVATA
jgi:chromosome segregation protein